MTDRYPEMMDELLTIKGSITKWYEYARLENISKNRQIMDLREKLTIYI